MKKSEYEMCIENLENIRTIAASLDYNTSVDINQNIIKILPLLKAEYEKLDKTKVDVNCPKLKIITSKDAFEVNQSIIDYLNTYMEQLKLNDYTIIDFGYIDNEVKSYAYVKYTS